MALTQLAPPYPVFTDKNGDPLDNGYLYFGEVDKNPETNPIQVYYDSRLTQPVAQPIRTSNGYVMRNGAPALIYAGSQFSVTVRDKNSDLVIYSPVGYGIDPGAIAGAVIVQDQIGDGVTTAFGMGASPATENATNVFIDGVYQSKAGYSISGSTLTFSEAPPLYSAIEIVSNQTAIVGGTDAGLVSYNEGGTGAVDRTVKAKLQETVSVKDFGAVGDWNGTTGTDDTAAIQAAVDHCLVSGDGLFFPTGRYRTTSVINIDKSASSLDPTQGGKMLSLRGSGPASSQIAADHNGVAINFVGGTGAGWHTYFYIDGIGITKANFGRNVGSIGLQLDDVAYGQFNRFDISYFEYGIKATDTLSSSFSDGSIRLNNYGFQFQKGTRSHPNNITFRGIITLNNQIWGGQVIQPSTFNYIGGSIESNGYTGIPGDPLSWGIDIQNGGTEGSVAAYFSGVYIENNNGRADVKILSDTKNATYSFSGCSFLRFSDIATRFVTNNIFFNSITESRLSLSGCGFKDYAPYVSSAAREFLVAPIGSVYDQGGNIFLDTAAGNIGINRTLYAPLGINHQIDFTTLPNVVKNRNGIQYCTDGTGSLLPSLAVSDGVKWWQIPLGQFAGRVASAGTVLKLPRGWSCVRNSTGVYTITHTLGLAANTYAVVATPSGAPGRGYCSGMTLSNNTFEIYFADTAGALADMDFNFNMQII